MNKDTKEGNKMIILAKPISTTFIVREDKTEEFLKIPRNEEALKKIIEKAKMIEQNRIK